MQRSYLIVDAYLRGEEIKYEPNYYVTKKDVTAATFEDRERMCRPTMEQLNAEERKDNFTEVVFGYDEEQAVEEAHRCLECGCVIALNVNSSLMQHVMELIRIVLQEIYQRGGIPRRASVYPERS